ncbi:hypothetical protein RIF25_04435 [Thermosynechococcaceae cyanobacterium BACA0444]|uniref:Uncharacterized protein n=1 Tax=Pseudocalidococcus azoricus BACA0444 TaxID=2918990 RepID=A0AAE4JVI2_9CYAN|nr:hypothetical protein [Pseudocalidococcus azoricus]MDS3860051.1 hypothetical protein [Pseudocalidococcus azoricus BACA0444]
MPEVTTQTDLSQVLTILQAMQGTLNAVQADVKIVQVDLQALTLEVKVNQAKTDERFKSIEEKVDALKQEVADLRLQQRTTDNRILTFLFTAFITAVGLLTKVIFFDRQE